MIIYRKKEKERRKKKENTEKIKIRFFAKRRFITVHSTLDNNIHDDINQFICG